MGWDRDPGALLRDIYEDDFGAALRDISLQALTGCVLKTPVDAGRARGGWLVTIGESAGGRTGADDKTGAPTIALGRGAISGARLGDIVTIENNVSYAVLLEEGPLKYTQFKSGKSAPARMVDRTLQELANNFGSDQ